MEDPHADDLTRVGQVRRRDPAFKDGCSMEGWHDDLFLNLPKEANVLCRDWSMIDSYVQPELHMQAGSIDSYIELRNIKN